MLHDKNSVNVSKEHSGGDAELSPRPAQVEELEAVLRLETHVKEGLHEELNLAQARAHQLEEMNVTAEQELETWRDLWALDHPLVYLACPYSHPDRNVRVARFEAANKAASALMRQGMKVFSPISHTHPIAEAGALPLGWDFWNDYDRAFIEHSCKVIVLRIDGWQQSTGVTAEIAIAEELDIPVEFVDPD